MAAVVTQGEIVARTQRMRDLPAADRLAAISSAENVVGYNRFTAHERKVQASRESNRTVQGKRP